MSKKIVAMLMAVAMAFSLLPVTAFAMGGPSATTPKDVVDGHYNDEGNWEFGKPGNAIPGLLKDTVTTVDKTAEKLADNQYKVTLKVQMKQKKTDVPPGAAATVLVIDTSGSMKYCTKEEHKHTDDCYQWAKCTPQVNPRHYLSGGSHRKYNTNCKYEDGRYIYPASQTCGKEEHEHNSDNCKAPYRIDAAKEAAKNFLKSYRGGTVSEDGTWTPSATSLNRYVSVVWFNKGVSSSEWLDVSTQPGYRTAINKINALSATNEGTNLDAGLRMANAQLKNNTVKGMSANVVVLTDGEPTYYLEESEYAIFDTVTIDGIKYKIQNNGKSCTQNTYNQTVSTAQTLKNSASVYTVCFGASKDQLNKIEGKPTVGTFLKTQIATKPVSGSTQRYAYDANDTTDLYKAFAAISSSVVSGLNTGKVTDALPNGVSCTDGTFNEKGELTWQLDPAQATKGGPDSNGFITYTYEKTYKVQINPTADGLNVEDGYVPLNLPTKLTVKNSDNRDVDIPFPIPAGKVTYSLTNFNKELVTSSEQLSFSTEGFTLPANTTDPVVISDGGVTLLYKITVSGDKGAKFTVTDDGATLVSPTDDSITFNQEGSTFSGTVGTTGETVFYVSKQFTKCDISIDTQTVSNIATIDPGDNAKGPDNTTATETTTVEKEKPTYTLTYDANGGKFDSENTKTETIDKTGDHALNYTSDYTPAYTSEGKKIVFLGWSTTRQNKVLSKSDVNDANSIASNIITKVNIPAVDTVYAVWSLDENNNNIPDIFEATVTYKIENGYWFRSEDGENIDKNDKNVTITLYEKSGHIWQKIDAKLGDTIPTGHGGEKGYTAQGWYKDSETDTVNIEAATPVTGNVTYTFKYTSASIPTTYTVVLHLENGAYTTVPDGYTTTSTSGVYQYTVTEPTTIIKPDTTTLSRSGYDFQGWSLSKTDSQTLIEENETFTELYVKQSVLTGNYDKIDLYAVWKKVDPPVDPVKLDVSRSKIASGLTKNSNGDWTTDVTLSLPSAEEELASDVVFVLDKSTSAALEQQALDMLKNLKEQAESTKATVKVGVVIFNKQANVTPLTDLATGYDTIEQAIKQEIKSGTNTHAGLLAGKQMLDEDTEVSANRKYLIFVSDGITYMYNAEPTATAWSFKADSWKHWAGPDNWKSKYSSNNPPADWSAWMTEIGAQVEAQGTEYEYSYDGTATKWTPEDDTTSKNYANSIDKALYLTYQVYQEAQTEGYNCYAVDKRSSTNYLWGPAFMNYLADGKTVNFDKIQNDILYAVSAGSTVTDIIGSKFSFEGIKSLTVGKQELTATKSGENTWYFGNNNTASESNYRFKVVYNSQDHQFVWTINEKVSNFAPVQLTYTVKLAKPETAAGTYGVTDLNGDEKVDDTGADVDTTKALYTNESATMVPKDSDGNTGEELTFLKPSVSYTVSSGNSGSHSGGSRPSLNTKDHYGYIIGYPVDYYTGQPTTDQAKKPVRPEGKITRAEVATIYFRMLTDESRTKFWSQNSGYSDVKAGDWFNNAVSTLSKAGIIAGYEDGSFRPNGYITRAEFATIAARFFDVTYNGKDLFPDISGHWARDYINQAANKGFVNGYEDGTFKPDRNITRAEAVTLVNRTLDRHPDKNHFTKDMLVWPDNMDQTKWYYADMQEATNSHTYQMKENSDKTKYENWTKTLPIRNWEALEKAWSNANSSQGNGNVV